MEASTSSPCIDYATTEIVFFDLETTVPKKSGQGFSVLEFGAIVVCPWKLVELESFCTLIRPRDITAVGMRSSRQGGITRDAVSRAPAFEEVADKIFAILNGRIWAGHNIQRFDCVRIKEAFAEIGRDAPVPVGMIDSLGVLTEKFGRRAGNMKVGPLVFVKSIQIPAYKLGPDQRALCSYLYQMETLASYFGLGQQKHRSLDDVRMNLEVVKHCATVLFLESSLPSLLRGKWQPSPSIITRSRSNNQHKMTCRGEGNNVISRKSPTSLGYQRAVPNGKASLGKMTEKMKSLFQGNQPLNHLLKHSLLR